MLQGLHAKGAAGTRRGCCEGAMSVLFRTICVRVRVTLVHGAGIVLLGSFGVRSVLQGKLSKGWILFAGLARRVFLTLSILRLAKLSLQGPFPDDLFLCVMGYACPCTDIEICTSSSREGQGDSG